MNGKNNYLLAVIMICLLAGCTATRQSLKEKELHPKREFRGAWIQTAFQTEYKDMTPQQMKRDFIRKLDFLHDCGINAIIFQVRPEADAFYQSKLEPWSRFYTGKQGVAPEGGFDLMAFLVDECHKRNMEFHAWLNPYRAGTVGMEFARSHIFHTYPGRFVEYNNQLLFDPGQPQNRRYICSVVEDIVSRYDVDAIHMDDYFYPYPAAGVDFPDYRSFERYGKPKGYTEQTKGDWRRENVNQLIRELHATIQKTKPWVQFGISPFGIYRNRKSTPDGSGSNTNGLQNYDDLYADVLLWVDEGWIDYLIPQLYWEIGHTAADYTTLAEWWNRHAKNRPLYIGQDVARTMDKKQLDEKMMSGRRLSHVSGNCFWPANELLKNTGGIADALKATYHRYPALIPAYTHLSKQTPPAVANLRKEAEGGKSCLKWSTERAAACYVVYCFPKGKRADTNNPAYIAGITAEASFALPPAGGKQKYTYAVTAVDRFHNESKAAKIKIRL